eukprot:gnl/Spiro4/29556_TR14478_c0_g1_i1.p1 gnl/Spiro4/29556_TR14478_c0_g1~~gnl/Spiro4/29556_TR14478_c0_g1_i1.p1  ORF type:complete len:1167 (+),score=471.93 gnl/Spiro4/29556_TR14478_c0_g1_i1:102-3602(+)
MTESVKVAVRVRPFNAREKERNAVLIITMNGHQTTITNPEGGEVKPFTFDYSYWSHDHSQKFHDQSDVYQDLGEGVLNNAWDGFNVSLFAYGQTGSGKSYSMVGYGEAKGIVPQACENLFRRVAANNDPNLKYEVTSSMMEIYNEQCRDLFNPASNKPGGLKVRENPKTGPYVEDLKSLAVSSYQEISDLMDEGTKARTVASTNMNATSSRAHTMFTIIFSQRRVAPATNKESVKVSKINLIDLAGSERQSGTGATGDRLKEGSAINKSLSALGNCIKALADLSKPHKDGKVPFVPYRDSVLTWLLKESLGGNAKTVMIAALSPADINYDETLSTLRYADRAKSIQNKAVVNEDPQTRMIRELKEQIEQLKKALRGEIPKDGLDLGGPGGPGGGGASEDKIREQMAESEKLMQSMNQSWEEKLREATRVAEERGRALAASGGGGDSTINEMKRTTPHLINLNEDFVMDGALVYILKPGITLIGTKQAPVPQDILLSGIGLIPEHAAVENISGQCEISPKSPSAKLFVNGKPCTERLHLRHNDRVIIGNNHIFKYIHPEEAARARAAREANPDAMPDVIDWEFATKEMHSAMMAKFSGGGSAEDAAAAARLAEMEREMRAKKEEMEKAERDRKNLEIKLSMLSGTADAAALLKEREEFEAQQARLQQQQRDLEAQLAAAKEEEKTRSSRKKISSALDELVLRTIPMINEANGISETLNKGMRFEPRVLAKVGANGVEEEGELAITVKDREDRMFTWSLPKFTNRLFIMKEQYQAFMDYGQLTEEMAKPENDPFYDPPEAQFIGKAVVYLRDIVMMFPIEKWFSIISNEGLVKGELEVHIHLCKPRERTLLSDEELDVEDFENLDRWLEPGRALTIQVTVKGARGLPSDTCNKVYVEYLLEGQQQVRQTVPCPERSLNPRIDDREWYTFDPVTPEILKYFSNEMLRFEVFGSFDEQPTEAGGGRVMNAKFSDIKKERDKLLTEKELIESRVNQLEAAREKERRDYEREREKLKEELAAQIGLLEGLTKGGGDTSSKINELRTHMEAERQKAIEEKTKEIEHLRIANDQLTKKLQQVGKEVTNAANVDKQEEQRAARVQKELEEAKKRNQELEQQLLAAAMGKPIPAPAQDQELQRQIEALKQEVERSKKQAEEAKKTAPPKSSGCRVL